MCVYTYRSFWITFVCSFLQILVLLADLSALFGLVKYFKCMQSPNFKVEGGAFLVPRLHLKSSRMQSTVRGKCPDKQADGKLGSFGISLYLRLFVVNFLCNICFLHFFIFCIVQCVANVETNRQTGSCSLPLAQSGCKNFTHNSHLLLRTQRGGHTLKCWSAQNCSNVVKNG